MSNISKNVKDVLEGRMYHDFENVDEVRELLECIQNNFNYKWLYGNKDHPFVKLWQRGDHFALVELLNLGNSIKNLIRNNNQEWLN